MTKATERMNTGDGGLEKHSAAMRATNQMGRSEDPRAGDEDDAEEVLGRSHVTEREG